MTPALRVVRPGLLTTVQDLGRPGLGRYGVSPSGAMDGWALRVANRLVGNPDGAAALELTGPGVELSALVAIRVAVVGADLDATCDAVQLRNGVATLFPEGARLRFPTRRRGARAILAVAGGIQLPAVLGSAATDLEAHLGGVDGQRLAKDVVLSVGAPPPAVDGVPYHVVEAPYGAGPLRFVPAQDLPPAILRAFTDTAWRISPRSSRSGYRLDGPPLPAFGAADRPSVPIGPGALQLPPDGRPILLMADRQTVGGYPVLGHLTACDEPRAAQLWPGDEVRFAPMTRADAHQVLRSRWAALSTALPAH